jgi:WXG100 family type VII secretion target
MTSASNEMLAGNQTLTRAAGMVAGAKTDFDRLSGNLSDQILGMASRWQGAGGLAFQNLHTAWQEKQAVIVRALNDFENSLVTTDRDFTTTDDTQAQTSNLNLGRLDGVSTL